MTYVLGKKTLKLVIEQLKNPKNLPFTINLYKCFEKNPYCRQHHGEVVVQSYNSKNDNWRLLYYTSHETEIIFQRYQDSEIILKHLEKSARKHFLKRDDVKKLIPSQDDFIGFRLPKNEKERLLSDAGTMGHSLSEYIRIRCNLN